MRPAARSKARASGAGPQRPRGAPRVVRIHRGHPGLRFAPAAVAGIIHLLDARAAEILPLAPAADGLRLVPPGELSIALLTAPALARLHATFLGDASRTDVITFSSPAAGSGWTWAGPVGEICVSADAAHAFAAAHGRDFSEELALYIVHGWLHLAGHDDLQPPAKRRMRAAEARALARLRTAGRIPRFTLVASPRP